MLLQIRYFSLIKLNKIAKIFILAILFNLSFYSYSQNLIINPEIKLVKENVVNSELGFGFNASLYHLQYFNLVGLVDTSWCLPWSNLSHCRYFYSTTPKFSGFFSGIEFAFTPHNKDSIIQGQLCKTVPINDTLEFEFKLRIRNFRKKYRKSISVICGISTLPISNNLIPLYTNDTTQIIGNISLKKVSSNYFVIKNKAITSIPVNYFFITCIAKNKIYYNYLYFTDFKIISKKITSCLDFTH